MRCVPIRVFHKNIFLMKKIGSTCSASISGLLWRNPKGFFILISFRGCTSHSCLEYFYIADFHSALTLPDRDLQSEGWVKKNGLFENTSQVSNLPSPPLSRTEQNKTRPRPIFSRFISYFLGDLSFASFLFYSNWGWVKIFDEPTIRPIGMIVSDEISRIKFSLT